MLRHALRINTTRRLLSSGPTTQIPKRVQELIQNNIKTQPLVLFMKGTPGYPMCGFSNLVIQILRLNGVSDDKVKAFNVLDDDELREGVKVFSEWPTIPQVYLGGEFVGGADIMRSLHESGDLKKMLVKHKLINQAE